MIAAAISFRTPILVALLVAPSLAHQPTEPPRDIPISELGRSYRLVGKLHRPLGQVVTLQGVVIDGPQKGYDDGPNLRIQRIDGVATQERIELKLYPLLGEFRDNDEPMPKPQAGKSYEFQAFESGEYIGTPHEAYELSKLAFQTTDHSFRTYLVAVRGKPIDPVIFSPADFLGHEALLEGRAASRNGRAYIEGRGWELLTDPAASWPADIESKTVEGLGTIRAADGTFRLEGATRLVRLEDQLDRHVTLRGHLWSMNNHWWFRYRGTDLYVEDLEHAPGFALSMHGSPVCIKGTLQQAKLPRIDQLTQNPDPDLERCFIVRHATVEPLPSLLGPECVESGRD